MRLAIGVVVLAYLLGSIPFSWLIVKLKTRKDVRSVGSGNVGATNAMRAAGKAAGIAALLLAATVIGLFIVWKHRPNIERIRQGIEPRLGERRAG